MSCKRTIRFSFSPTLSTLLFLWTYDFPIVSPILSATIILFSSSFLFPTFFFEDKTKHKFEDSRGKVKRKEMIRGVTLLLY